MFEKCLLIHTSSKCVHCYGISTKLCISSCYPFRLVLLCFVQQENNLDPVCKQIWAASACAGPRIWRAGKWYTEKLELSGSKPAGVELSLLAPGLCHSGAALLLPDLSWQVPAPLCSSGRKKGTEMHLRCLLPEGWDQTLVSCQITTAGFSSASVLLQGSGLSGFTE